MTSKFRILDENVVWSNHRGMAMAEVTVESPEGERLRRDVMHHPGAVGILPLHDDGTVTLVRQYRVAVDDDIWEIPAGLRDVEGEPPAVTATRELAEETGLAAAEVRFLTRFHNSPGCSDEVVEVFVATGLTDVPDDRQGAEEQHMEVARLPLAEALAMVGDGRITDSKTVIGLLLVSRMG